MPTAPPTITDNLLAPADYRALVAALDSRNFPWERSQVLSDGQTELNATDNLQLVHGLFLWNRDGEYRSPWLPIIAPVLAHFGRIRLLKAKLNRTLRQSRHIEYGMHVDTRAPRAVTAILYLNTNDGYTLFADGTRIASVANRLVQFDAALLHTGASCTDSPYRQVLNLNLIPISDA